MLIKLLVAALVLLVVLFVALVWLVAKLAGITLWLPAGVTAFVVLCAVCGLLYRRVKASGAARGLEQALAGQAQVHAKVVRPDLQAEVQSMQAEFDKAVAALKSAKLGPGGHSALYFLPWYTIIGPPGAGKSTALRSSGLHFPYTSGSGGAAVKGLGGTRNCDWWLTNEAVILDTAGRWSTQEEDHDEWLAFLGLLRRYRPKKPLNGLIAAISVGDVVHARDEEVEALAQRMRERLDEVHAQLRVSIPVYVLFTKTDLVEGFLETFGDLKKSERGQVWGFTLPLSERQSDPAALFNERFNELSGVIEKRSLSRMADERSLERRAAIYAFPQQFSALRRNLERFIGVMFQGNVYQTTPTLRGVYFTSGTQEGRPFNLLMNRLADAIGVRRRAAVADAPVDQKSYFLHDVFMNVIFEDRAVASASEAELKRQRVRRLGITASLGLVSLVMGIVPSYAWSLNKYQLTRLQAAIDEWKTPGAQALDFKQKLERLEPLRARVDTLTDYEQGSGVPLSMRAGMYQQAALLPPLQRYYANLLRRELVQPVLVRDAQTMTDFGLRFQAVPQATPSEDEQRLLYDQLKLHLTLTQPKQPSEPPLDDARRAWVEAQLRAHWLPGEPQDAKLLQAAQVNAKLYTSYLGELSELAFTRDKEVVQRVRAALNRVPATARALRALIARGEQEGYALGLPQLIGASTAFKQSGRVHGIFTRRGYENIARDGMTPELLEDAGELWVLGLADAKEQVQQQRAQQLMQLRSAYFRAYIEEWQDFLRSVHAADNPKDNLASLELLRELTRGAPPPVALLLHKVHYNTQLPPKPAEGTDLAQAVAKNALNAVVDKITGVLGPGKAKDQLKARVSSARAEPEQLSEKDVANAFAGLCAFAVPPDTGNDGPRAAVPFDVYQEQLSFVRDALQTYLDDPSQSAQLQARLQDARTRVRALIAQQETGTRPIFEALIWPPIDGAVGSGIDSIIRSISEAYCSAVASEFQRSIAGRYPFNRDGQDMALADFSNFYQPKQGKLWTFLDKQMSKSVLLDGDHYTYARQLGQEGSRSYTSALLEFLDRSREVTLSFFPGDAPEPRLEFEVKVQPSPGVSMTQFMVGGKAVTHYNGPEAWKTLVWPGDNPSAGAYIDVRGANGMHERIPQDGPWGLFRLLEAGSLVRGAGGTFTVAWRLETHDVTLKADFRPRRSESPFFGVPGQTSQPVLMQPVRARGVSAPRQIATSAPGCSR